MIMLSESDYRAAEQDRIEAEQRKKQAEAEARRQELIRLQQENQAAEAVKQQQQQEQQDAEAIRQAAVEAQPQQREEGFVTKVGEGIGYTLSPDGLTADVLNAAAAGINQLSGGNLQGLDDFCLR